MSVSGSPEHGTGPSSDFCTRLDYQVIEWATACVEKISAVRGLSTGMRGQKALTSSLINIIFASIIFIYSY